MSNFGFDKGTFLCNLPYTNVEIKSNGDVYICCPAWNPTVIGNLLQDDLRTIWTGSKARALRDSMQDASFKYCNNKTCPAMLNSGVFHHIVERDTFQDPNLNYPNLLSFSIDNTCNLECPSCRAHKILTSSPKKQREAYTVMKNIFNTIFETPHDNHVSLTMDGEGEIFHSTVYRQLFDNTPEFKSDEWPNVKFVLCTNGTMMTPKIQDKYDYILDRAFSYRFSIDAGNEATYNIVRKGGNWDMLWANVQYCYDTRISIDRTHWSFNLILQKDNYESLPDLVKIANTYKHKPEIYITNMLHWTNEIMSVDEFHDKAVWLESHPEHERMKEIFSMPIVCDYPNILKPF